VTAIKNLFTLVAIAAVLTVGFMVIQRMPEPHTPNGQVVDNTERPVTFVVVFTPTVREKVVTIQHTDTHTISPFTDSTKVSPWTNMRTFKPGTPVQLSAFQSEGSEHRLECFIKVNDEVLAADVRHGIGSVNCSAVVP
jgi:hypothetical protein